MTQDKAIYQFLSSFGMTAYAEAAVPEDAVFPFLTYELITGAYNQRTTITVNLWFYTSSEAEPNAKAAEISAAIGMGGITIPCDGGALWIKRGTPWCQSLRDETNNNIKRRYLLLDIDYLTT